MQRPNASAASALLALSLLALHFPPAVAQQSKVAPKLVSTIDESLDYRWSPDGKSLAVRGYEDVSLYDAASGKARAVIKVEALWPLPKSVNFTPDGRTLVVQTDRVRLYDAADGRLLREFGERTSAIS